jgi:hypothetical protein
MIVNHGVKLGRAAEHGHLRIFFLWMIFVLNDSDYFVSSAAAAPKILEERGGVGEVAHEKHAHGGRDLAQSECFPTCPCYEGREREKGDYG